MPIKEMRVFPCCMGEGEYFAGGGPPFQAGMEAPFVFEEKTLGQTSVLSPCFFATKTGSSPANGLEPSFLTADAGELPLRLTPCQLFHLALCRTAGIGAGRFRGGFLACGALHLLAFNFVGNALGICHEFCVPLIDGGYAFSSWAYFSTSFFKPNLGNCTVIFASSPSPSRLYTVPSPYLGCRTRCPGRNPVRPVGWETSTLGRENFLPREAKNSAMLSMEL